MAYTEWKPALYILHIHTNRNSKKYTSTQKSTFSLPTTVFDAKIYFRFRTKLQFNTIFGFHTKLHFHSISTSPQTRLHHKTTLLRLVSHISPRHIRAKLPSHAKIHKITLNTKHHRCPHKTPPSHKTSLTRKNIHFEIILSQRSQLLSTRN